MMLRVDPRSEVPIVRQIVDGMRVLLVEKKLAPGASLPSVRRVAMELGVHFNTVAEAYRQLATEGWLDLKHGRGARVVDREAPAPDQARSVEFRSRLRALVSEMRAHGFEGSQIAAELRALEELVMS